MDLSFLPIEILFCLDKVDLTKLFEIRLRLDFPIKLLAFDKSYYLSKEGLSIIEEKAIICKKSDIDYIIKTLTDSSFYAFNDNIKNGFLTSKNGIRVGVAGECVFDKNEIVTIKNISSLNIRLPHYIKDCSKKVINYIIFNNIITNTLIVSPPALGKTTLLKDICVYLNNHTDKSILIIDERGEFGQIKGRNIDTISYSDKLYAFNYGIRSMSPNIVVTDELITKRDWECVNSAKNSGVIIIASCHGNSMENIINKEYFIKNVFDRYIILNNVGKPGVVSCIYNNNFEKIL